MFSRALFSSEHFPFTSILLKVYLPSVFLPSKPFLYNLPFIFFSFFPSSPFSVLPPSFACNVYFATVSLQFFSFNNLLLSVISLEYLLQECYNPSRISRLFFSVPLDCEYVLVRILPVSEIFPCTNCPFTEFPTIFPSYYFSCNNIIIFFNILFPPIFFSVKVSVPLQSIFLLNFSILSVIF